MKEFFACPICSSKSRLIKTSADYSFLKCEGCEVCYCSPFPEDISGIYDDYFFNQGYKSNYFDYLPLVKNSLAKKVRLL